MTDERRSFWGRFTAFLQRRSPVLVLVLGVGTGIIFWGGFNTVLEMTNKTEFCISCHEMYENVYLEYQNTVHYNNRTGVRATCPDCHVPKDWVHKFVRKVRKGRK